MRWFNADEKKLIRVKSRYGVNLLGTQLLIDDRAWVVCGLAKQEFNNSFVWQWWIIMPDKHNF